MTEEKEFSEEDEEITSEEEEEGESHDQLLQVISSLEPQAKKDNEGKDQLTTEEDKKSIDTAQLLQGITNKKGLKQLKQRLNKLNDQYLLKPLPTVQKDRIHRKLAYERSSKQVSDWDAVVKHNRNADHLQFPLQEEVPPLPSLTTKVDSFKAVTPLEIAVQNMLSKSDHVIEDGEELSKVEKRELLKLSIQEAKERRAELSKMRSLLSAYEQKQKRIKRIKSKKFHKIQRKIKEKMDEKREVTESEQGDLLEKADRLRAQERATLKHSKMTKWAKNHINKKHSDPATRHALTEQGRLKSELKQKAYQESDSDEEEKEDEETMENDEDQMRELIEKMATDSDNIWLSSAVSSSTKTDKGDLGDLTEDKDHDEEEEAVIDSDTDSIDQDTLIEQKRFPQEKRRKVNDNVVKTDSKRVNTFIDPTDFLTMESLRNELTDKNAQAVKEAFADDDVVVEFLKEKQDEVEEMSKAKKKVDLTLPGWGEWAGEGVVISKENKKKKKEETIAPPPPPRKDDHLKYVIINHSHDRKAAKHYVSQLPYSYTDKRLFAKKMATPIGRHWNTETHFNETIKPRIQTKVGSVIEPMKMTDEVEQFIKKTKSEQRKRKHVKSN